MPCCPAVLLSLYCIVIVFLNEINGDGEHFWISGFTPWAVSRISLPYVGFYYSCHFRCYCLHGKLSSGV